MPNSKPKETSATSLSKPNFDKSSLLLKEVSVVLSPNSERSTTTRTRSSKSQKKKILSNYDEVDLQIMQMCQEKGNISDKRNLSQAHEEELNADKELKKNSKSGVQENSDSRRLGERKSSNAAAGIRRSNRKRYSPLERWRNERLLYCCKKGEIQILGVDKGIAQDDAHIQALIKKYGHIKAKNKISKPKKAKLINVAENKQEMLFADIIKIFATTPWNVSEEQQTKLKQPYLIKRMFETEKNGFGYLQIEVDKEKSEQYMPEDDLHMTLVRGNVELTIQENKYEIKEKDMFIIPRSCAYSIKNIGNIKALLTYVVGKFRFLESLKV